MAEKQQTKEQKEKDENELLGTIQAALETMQGNGDIDILFLASRNNRGVLSGTLEGLAALFAYNMVAYPQFRLVIEFAQELLKKHRDEIEKFVKEERPSHEIVNNFGTDIEQMIANLEKNNN